MATYLTWAQKDCEFKSRLPEKYKSSIGLMVIYGRS